MKRFFWKEWRERALWFTLWVLSVVVLAALGVGQRFTGNFGDSTEWFMLPVGLALLAGLLGYSSELRGERATFLYSRALLWKPLLAAKVLSGLMVTVLAVTLGAVACYLAIPEAYHMVVTPTSLAAGAAEMAAFTGVAYLLGLCCSIVLPGLAGSIITLLIWVGMYLLVVEYRYSATPGVAVFGLLASPLVALVVLARFGLTLTWVQRLLRFVLITGNVMAVGVLLDLLPGVRSTVVDAMSSGSSIEQVRVSPDGQYAVIDQYGDKPSVELLQLATGRRERLLPSNISFARWLTNDCALLTGELPTDSEHTTSGPEQTLMSIINGRPSLLSVYIPETVYVSPDGTRLLTADSTQLVVIDPRSGAEQEVRRISIKRIRTKAPRPLPGLSSQCWWQDNHTIGYIDPFTGKRVLAPVR